MREIIKGNLELIKVAPLRSILGFILLIPHLLFSVAIIIGLSGMAMEMFSNLLLFGLSGLDHKFEWEFYKIIAQFCLSIFEFLVPFGGMALKMFLLIPYLLAAVFLLGSAHKRLEIKKSKQ